MPGGKRRDAPSMMTSVYISVCASILHPFAGSVWRMITQPANGLVKGPSHGCNKVLPLAARSGGVNTGAVVALTSVTTASPTHNKKPGLIRPGFL